MVNESSACLDGHRKLPLLKDHLKINKYNGPDDPAFKKVYPEIVEMAKNSLQKIERRRQPLKTLYNERFSEDDQKLLRSMFLTNPRSDLRDITTRSERVAKTCEWLLAEGQFAAWLNGKGAPLLHLIGRPGLGKTVIATFLVEELEECAKSSPNMTFAYYFCDNKNHKRKTATAIIRGLLRLLLLQHHELIELLKKDVKTTGDGFFEDFHGLWESFVKVTNHRTAGEVYLLVDALDECEKDERKLLLKNFSRLFCSPSNSETKKVKLLVTSRPEDDINLVKRNAPQISSALQLDLKNDKINEDLSRFIEDKVNNTFSWKGDNLVKHVRDVLIENAEGTFLWASFVLKDLESIPKDQVREKLKTLPKSLSEVYDRMLQQIKFDNAGVAEFVLRYVAVALRPLTVSELAMAYMLEKEDRTKDTIPSEDNQAEFDEIWKNCEHLVYLNEEHQTVNLQHQSVKDYLVGEQLERHPELSRYHVRKKEANLLVFGTCWRFLCKKEFNKGRRLIDCTPDNRLFEGDSRWRYEKKHTFLSYTLKSWYGHAKEASPNSARSVRDGLHESPTFRDTWLLRAAEERHKEMVKLLLENGAEPDSRNNVGETSLILAARHGQKAIAKQLLEKGADVNANGEYGTALQAPSAGGHDTVVERLLEKGADVNVTGGHYGTALQAASAGGHDTVVERLLEKGADVNVTGGHYGTALQAASAGGHDTVVERLLEKGADVNVTGGHYGTALQAASACGHDTVVERLLEKGADVNVTGGRYGTALHAASAKGPRVLKQFLSS